MTLSASFAFDLALATTVEFRYRKKGSATVAAIALVVLDALAKRVRLDIPADLSDEQGIYDCHVHIVIAAKSMYIPQGEYDAFSVGESF